MSSENKVKLGPIELEVIHGTIRAAELEIEAAVELVRSGGAVAAAESALAEPLG